MQLSDREKPLVNEASTVRLCVPCQAACSPAFFLFFWAVDKQKWSCWQEFSYSLSRKMHDCNKNNGMRGEKKAEFTEFIIFLVGFRAACPEQMTGHRFKTGQRSILLNTWMNRRKQSSALCWLLQPPFKHSLCVGLSAGLSSPDRFRSLKKKKARKKWRLKADSLLLLIFQKQLSSHQPCLVGITTRVNPTSGSHH